MQSVSTYPVHKGIHDCMIITLQTTASNKVLDILSAADVGDRTIPKVSIITKLLFLF